MTLPTFPIVGWARTAVAPVGGALADLSVHALAAPVVRRLLRDANLPAPAVDTLVLGNALGAGGNPARLVALAAGLPEHCPALTVDTQCCASLDAISLACGLLASGQAEIVIAGGAEAWSRAPLRLHRPRHRHEAPQAYEQPPFTPWPARDPDMLAAAAHHAAQTGLTRERQDAYAAQSHARALQARTAMNEEIEPVAGLTHDSYPRALDTRRLSRMPIVAGEDPAFAVSTVAVSTKADGAAFVLLATDAACRRWGLPTRAHWHGSVSMGGPPEVPMRCAAQAAQRLLARLDWDLAGLAALELHDAFAAQGLDFQATLGLPDGLINRGGGGLARGHPIGASGAIALVRLLSQLHRRANPHAEPGGVADTAFGTLRGVSYSPIQGTLSSANSSTSRRSSSAVNEPTGARRGLACIAGAGGIGAAVAVTCEPSTP